MTRPSRRDCPRLPRRTPGMALLSVLLLSLVMGVLVMAMLDDIRFGVQRTANAQAMAQARQFALGAESMARARVKQFALPNVPPHTWADRPLVFPIENGLVHARLRDASTCFNLNSVVEGIPGQYRRRELGVRQYVALLQALEIPAAQAQALADALADWIDTDNERAPLGAEDATYAGRDLGYRTAGTLLAEASELRALQGYGPGLYERLRPHVCALPEAILSPVNVNALDPAQAPVLSMLTLGALTPAQAARLIRTRPVQGWDNQTFTAQVTALKPDDTLFNEFYDQYRLEPRWFELDVDVDYAGAQATLTALLEYRGMGDARLAARRWTRNE